MRPRIWAFCWLTNSGQYCGRWILAALLGCHGVCHCALRFPGSMVFVSICASIFEERFALIATIGIWLASSLPAYMYGDPSWAHAHSVFAGGLFLWYWHRTLGRRTGVEWLILGLIAGLMLDVYYANFVFLIAPVFEWVSDLRREMLKPVRDSRAIPTIVAHSAILALAAGIRPSCRRS